MTIATTRPGTQLRQTFIHRSCCVEVLMGKYDATHSAAGNETGNLSPIESHGPERLVNVSSSAGPWLGGL
jgi:hypothetical protein